ncbi:MAG: trypsin-like peptidase domain-containing protein [Chthoniobacterales bacterium]|nr:trypsin-like peptidase domain-containing protein [Chthoniobacterales bacterium]
MDRAQRFPGTIKLRVAPSDDPAQIPAVNFRLLPVLIALVVALSPAAQAVVINTASGTGNTNAPSDDPGWANVGVLNGASGIYLGAGWVLTAAHVGVGSISFAGVSYNALTNTLVQLTNNAPGRTVFTDLIMFQLASTPAGLGPLTLASSAPTLGTAVTMIGAGRDRGAFTEWNVNQATTPWTWTVVSSSGNAAGYQTLESQTLRWGTNTVSSTDFWVSADGSPDVKSFSTTFTDSFFASNEAQAVLGDSGGAVFTKRESAWELGGVMFGVGGYSGQPSATTNAIYGNVTYSADLSFYSPQIMSIIPEPTTYALLALSAATMVLMMRRS